MPEVNTSMRMGALNRERLWRALCDFERYPEFVKDVLEVRVLHRTPTEIVSEWRVLLDGSELSWTERGVLTDDYRVIFEQTDGDLAVWQGQWRLVVAEDGSATVERDVSFDLGVPSLAQILDPIGERAVRANSRKMLEGLRARLASESNPGVASA